jgi:hypothetical protein
MQPCKTLVTEEKQNAPFMLSLILFSHSAHPPHAPAHTPHTHTHLTQSHAYLASSEHTH